MGIPSYFSHIIKSYPSILNNLYSLKKKNTNWNALYMDCNSIIYDCFYRLEKEKGGLTHDVFRSKLIDEVIETISHYIRFISPSDVAYIAFDGVAPFAKMEQQRNRRYKTWHMKTIETAGQGVENASPMQTSAFTPGTVFMRELSDRVSSFFHQKEAKYSLKKIIVSTSNQAGEGEHKMFQYMREHSSDTDTVAVYGLDADLIMLSIFHCYRTKNIYIFREAPEFLKSSIPVTTSFPNEPYFLDIDLLSIQILRTMKCENPETRRIFDYVFLCFFLGNDFLPHFPGFNIRTHGIQTLLGVYGIYIGKYPDRFLVDRDGCVINWKWVNLFVRELSIIEHEMLMDEYNIRDKWAYQAKKEHLSTGASTISEEKRAAAIQATPILYRASEEYISPSESYWEERYYKALFGKTRNDEFVKSLSLNYLQGLEWVFKYYTLGCPDWKWKYHYHYPPLMKDLVLHIPVKNTVFIDKNQNVAFKPCVQLAYVLPREQLHLLDKPNADFLLNHYGELYPSTISFEWSFCRHFWESHAVLPHISMNVLDSWDKTLSVS
jgi:5'-3' exonuclease